MIPAGHMPALSGRYKTIGVSSFYLQAPASPSQPDSGEKPAAQQDEERIEVVVKCFYPSSTAVPPAPTVPYINKEQAEAVASFAHVPAFLFAHLPKIKLLAVQSAPVLPAADSASPRLPVVIYSHGLGGLPETYQIQACDLASRGFVVLMPTHNDRSASISILPDGRRILYKAVSGAEEKAVRSAGLARRVDEMLLVLDAVTDADRKELPFDVAHLRTDMLARLDSTKVAIIGHSFGAATCMATAAVEQLQAEKQQRASRISSVVSHDQWMLPVHHMLNKVKLALSVPTLITVSEGFYRWNENYTAVRALYESFMPSAKSRMLLISQSQHNNYSDVGIFSPFLTRLSGALGKIDHELCWRLLNEYNALWSGQAMHLPADSPQLENLSTDLLDDTKKPEDIVWL